MSGIDICANEEATYTHRVYDSQHHNFCTVEEKGFDAVLFVAIGVTFTCLFPRKHYAICMLLLGAALQSLNLFVNTRELSNALSLWIGITPAKTFFYIFLPPLLLDSAVRIDFFVFRKVMSQVFVLAFGVVAINTVLLAVFMLYVLNLRSEGWGWTEGFLFACMIASTDALAVTAIMKDGSGPESLVILTEGESLFNDATSIVFFDLFWPRFKDKVEGNLKDESIGIVVGNMTLEILWLAVGGAIIGWIGGWITRFIFKHLQHRHGHTPVVEVGITVGMSYLCYYVSESVVGVSGVISVVVYGLYGAATTQWDISPSARESKVFSGFWDVTQLLTNGIVFFYAGASATNFFYRCEEDLFHDETTRDGLLTILVWLPSVYVGIFLLRFLEIAVVAPIVGMCGFKLKLNEMVFISLAGLRGALALILAEDLLQYEFLENPNNDHKIDRKVRAQSVLWVCGFVLLTLVINAPGIPFLLKACGLSHLSPIQMQYRKKSEQLLEEFTQTRIEEMKTDELEVTRGINWKQVENFIFQRSEENFEETSFSHPLASWNFENGVVDDRWRLVESLTHPPEVPLSQPESSSPQEIHTLTEQYKQVTTDDAPFEGSYRQEAMPLGEEEEGQSTEPMITTKSFGRRKSIEPTRTCTNTVIVAFGKEKSPQLLEQFRELPEMFRLYMETSKVPKTGTSERFFTQSRFYFNLVRRNVDLPSLWQPNQSERSPNPQHVPTRPLRARKKSIQSFSLPDASLSIGLLETNELDQENDAESHRDMVLTEARFRMLLGLKKYFHERRTAGFLSPQGLRLLEWACDLNMEEPEVPLRVWDTISADIRSRFIIKFASHVRYLLRKATVELRGWPVCIETFFRPLLNGTSRGLNSLLLEELHIAVEAAIEYWIGLNIYRTHSAWLVSSETVEKLASQIRDQAQMVWAYIMDREVESPDRFEAIQTYRATRAILQSQMDFVEELFQHGLLEEAEHEHLYRELETQRSRLNRSGAVQYNFDVVDFLQNVPFFTNISSDVFRRLISMCQLRQYADGELISIGSGTQTEPFSFSIIINGILRSSYTNSLGKVHEYNLGRGGIFGLLSALSGEYYPWIGKGYAELNASGHGPTVLTVPHSTLMRIHKLATEGQLQYQQLELDLFRMAALYIVEYMHEEFMGQASGLCLSSVFAEVAHASTENGTGDEVSSDICERCLRCLDGTPFEPQKVEFLQGMDNFARAVQLSHDEAADALKTLKEGLVRGELILLPADSKFIQSASSVLVVGSLFPIGRSRAMLRAPIVLPWLVEEPDAMLEYKTGPDGAILIGCPTSQTSGPESSLGTRTVDDGMRFGTTMAPMPSIATRIQSHLFK